MTQSSALGFIEVVRADLRRVFRLSLLAVSLVHLAVLGGLVQRRGPTKEATQRAEKPLPVEFSIRRDPRVTKPFELRKATQAKRQLFERQVQRAQASLNQVQSTASCNTRGLVSQVVAAPNLAPARGLALDAGAAKLEPTLTTGAVAGVRQQENRIDMALEMLDVNSMDTGRYRAMVVQEGADRQAIEGFTDLALVMSARSVAVGNWSDVGVKVVDEVVDAVNEYTGLKARSIGQITYDDSRLMDVPIIYPIGDPNMVLLACSRETRSGRRPNAWRLAPRRLRFGRRLGSSPPDASSGSTRRPGAQ